MVNKTTNTNKNTKGVGSAGGTLGVLAIVSTVISIATPLIDIVDDKLKERAEERKDWVTIPELCSKTIPMKLDCTIDALEKLDLKVGYSAIDLKNANSKYKDCFDLQIVWSDHKRKQKVKPGTLVLLKYVTSEIIEESQRLFDESEKQKAEAKCAKANKINVQQQKAKKIVNSSLETIFKRHPEPIDLVDDMSDYEKEKSCE